VKRSFLLIGILCLLVPFAFWGCSGDDGATGATGAPGSNGLPGPPGADGQDLTAAPQPESCAVCHGVGKIRDVTSVHAITGVASVTVVGTPTIDGGGNLVVNLRAAIDGVPSNIFTLRRAYVNYDNAALTVPAQYAGLPVLAKKVSRRFDNLQPDNVTIVNTGAGGNYTATIPPANVIDNGTYLFQLQSTGTTERPTASFTHGTRALRNLVTDTGCANCHGPYPAWSQNFQHYAVGGSNCQICHTQLSPSVRTMEARTLNAGGTLDNLTTAVGSNFPEYIHGIHNSHNMPGGIYYRSNPAAGETPEDLNTEERYSVGYPSDMRHCNVCHETEVQREAIASAPVTYALCMSCHQNWDGFRHVHDGTQVPPQWEAGDPIFGPTNFHRSAGPTTDCMGCHSVLSTINEVSDFHNDFQGTDAHYDSFYRGEDISFNPLAVDNVLFAITGIQKSGDNVSFTWTATRNGVAVNPCNDNISSGPTFRSLGAYLAYAKGDDWVNENVSATQSPGQPLGTRNLFTSLSTTCASNVATTTGLVVAQGPKAYAQKALLAIGGKPLVRGTFMIGSTPTAKDYFIRVPSPTRAFSMADGSAVAARRPAVDSAKCNKCHQGTMYQHGGDRVDNEQMCVICHNPSASEKNVRASGGSAGYRILNPDNTVNTSATYDGKVAETYDMRYLLHAVHGAEKREKPIVIYRTRGIFAFAPPVYEFRPTSGGGTERISIEHPRPTGWPADEITARPVYGSLDLDNQVHTWTTIHYPKPLKECLACHTSSAYIDPADQTAAVPLTVDPGTSYSSQTDDIVIGPSAAACTGCHESTGPEGIPVQRHVTYDFGYKANVAKEVMLQKAQAVSLSPVLSEAVAGP
jgi:OmcA/MtrC family decaheme c-type cytochrome